MLPRLLASLLLLLLTVSLSAQEEEEPRNWSLTGYVKNLQTGLFFNGVPPDTYVQDNLIHNRLNFRWFPHQNWRLRADLRTRIFYGDLVRMTPNYGEQVDDVNNDYFDWSTVLFTGQSWVGHTMLDRLYLEYAKGDWEIRLGDSASTGASVPSGTPTTSSMPLPSPISTTRSGPAAMCCA